MERTALVLAGALALPAGLFAETTVDQKRAAAADGNVVIETVSGSVKVGGWDRLEVQVKGTLADRAELKLSGSGKDTRIEVESESGSEHGVHGHRARRADLEVFVPKGSSLRIECAQATIAVSGVAGAVSAETVSGSITHSGPSRGVQLHSVSGSVETTKAAGRIEVEAVDGTVTVRDGAGELDASTVNGKLAVLGGSFERAGLESVSGLVRFAAGLSASANLEIETVSGAVEVLLPPGFGANVEAESFSGAIENELAPATGHAAGWGPGKKLSFKSGAGGARVSLETLSGAIRILKKQETAAASSGR